MDPVAHTLFGATLAEAGLKRASRYSVATLIIGANLPDIDGVCMLWGTDASLHYRRGWTHGILALVVLPLVLAGGIWLWHRWRGGGGGGPPFQPGKIVGLSYLAVLSHPALDWLNTYGVRLLMPFDGRWFYGDTLFVIDPWFWLLTAAAVVLAYSHSKSSTAGWLMLATASSILILFSGMASVWVSMLWLIGLSAIAVLRWLKPGEMTIQNIARGCIVTLMIYISAAYGFARMAESSAAERYPEVQATQANPIPGSPNTHRVVGVNDEKYQILRADGSSLELPREKPGPIIQAALSDPSVRGFTTWMRYPYWEVTEAESGWTVTFYDLRYTEPGQPAGGIGRAQVFVPR